ncbi:hypothetical protein [Rhodopirellula bahusiensis]|uniref:Uncharacterized protein n=1 Tax=Rhodopirellula bahusiensis TaxID=2014065 RepID=A0A2G1W737_9BACT|nr:hypothetical protein [Rhodopirellula bahusiensis]PHQ34827.1 hypothetical protein CEE69_13225 [Rhodopirellula bahusiensis]
MFLKPLDLSDGIVITRLNDDTFFDGYRFVSDITSAKRYEFLSEALFEISEIEDQYGESAKQRTYILPVTVQVAGDVTRQEVGEYLESAIKLIMNREDFGNGPTPESYVESEAHWHLIKEMPNRLDEDPDEPDFSLGYYIDPEDI